MVSASVGFAMPAKAQVATATAKAQYSITSFGWLLGVTDFEDDNGNYDIAWLSPPGITSTVNLSDVGAAHAGTITVTQHFVLEPYTGSVPSLQYNVHLTANAGIGSNLQMGFARASHSGPILPEEIDDDVVALALASGTTTTAADQKDDPVGWPAGPTYTDTSVVFALAQNLPDAVVLRDRIPLQPLLTKWLQTWQLDQWDSACKPYCS